MGEKISVFFGLMVAAGLVTTSVFAASSGPAAGKSNLREKYIPTIWVDPDGCEHWVMDDGAEGYMTPHVTRAGIPVCNRGNTCAVMNSDQLFAVDKWSISATNRARLSNFFKTAGAITYLIDGHTDSDASDAYNMRLSKRRAQAVARVAQKAGFTVQARWFGERAPLASNRTSSGKAKNRRVEIICIR